MLPLVVPKGLVGCQASGYDLSVSCILNLQANTGRIRRVAVCLNTGWLSDWFEAEKQ